MGKIFGASVSLRSRLQEGQRCTMDWLVDDALIDGAELSVARMTLKQGACSERHGHPNCNEVIHLIRGSVEQSVGDELFDMQAGDTVFIPRGRQHQTRNVGNGEAIMIVCYSAGERIYESALEGRLGER